MRPEGRHLEPVRKERTTRLRVARRRAVEFGKHGERRRSPLTVTNLRSAQLER